jgi:hypothetical protein
MRRVVYRPKKPIEGVSPAEAREIEFVKNVHWAFLIIISTLIGLVQLPIMMMSSNEFYRTPREYMYSSLIVMLVMVIFLFYFARKTEKYKGRDVVFIEKRPSKLSLMIVIMTLTSIIGYQLALEHFPGTHLSYEDHYILEEPAKYSSDRIRWATNSGEDLPPIKNVTVTVWIHHDGGLSGGECYIQGKAYGNGSDVRLEGWFQKQEIKHDEYDLRFSFTKTMEDDVELYKMKFLIYYGDDPVKEEVIDL